MNNDEKVVWVGCDVSSGSFCAAIDLPVMFDGQESKEVTQLENKAFKMTEQGVKSFVSWVGNCQDSFFSDYSEREMDRLPVRVVMESTGTYSLKLEKMLYAAMPDIAVIIINPKLIVAHRTSLNIKDKTDPLDSQVIARFGSERRPVAREKLPEEYQKLRELSRTRLFMKDQRTAVNNFHDSTLNSTAKRMCTAVSKQYDKEIAGLDREIDRIVQETPEIQHEVEIMTSMPGIGEGTAVAILGEIGSLKNYSRRAQVVAICGLNPVRKQSGTSVNSTYLSKRGSPIVRRFLYMCSKSAVPRVQVLRDLYDRLIQKGKTKMQARCAVMRKMLLLLRGMVRNDQKFVNSQKNL